MLNCDYSQATYSQWKRVRKKNNKKQKQQQKRNEPKA